MTRAFYGCCAGLIGFAFAYTLPIYAHLPRTFYDPVARRWFVAALAAPVPMGYVGQIVWGIAGALIFAGAALTLARRPPSARTVGLLSAWTLTAVAVVLAYFTWNNWP